MSVHTSLLYPDGDNLANEQGQKIVSYVNFFSDINLDRMYMILLEIRRTRRGIPLFTMFNKGLDFSWIRKSALPYDAYSRSRIDD